jgi:CDP-glucose 4,6-dehydratase
VEWIVKKICDKWGQNTSYEVNKEKKPHEAHYLKLDCSKAKVELGWYPKWNLERAIDKVVEWVRAYRDGKDMRKVCYEQIREYEELN